MAINAPDSFWSALDDSEAQAQFVSESDQFVIVFVTTAAELEAAAAELPSTLDPDGMLWMSWPKKPSSIESEVGFDEVQTRLLETGLVDVKVCAIDEDWSGLKFVVRKELRGAWHQ